MFGVPLLLFSLLAADRPLSEIYSRAQEEVDQLKCPCTEAGVTFSSADLPICKSFLVTVKELQAMSPEQRQNVRPTLEGWTKVFVDCVQRVQRVRAAKEERGRVDEKEREHQMSIADEEKRIRLLVIDGHSNGNIMQVVDSAILCDAKGKRGETLEKIATERRYSKRVGVVNLSDLEDLKQELREEDERIATVTADLRRVRKNALRCNDSRLSALQNCHDLAAAQSTLPDECDEDSMRVKLAIFRED